MHCAAGSCFQYVSPEVKELRMIFEGQNAIHSHLRDVQSRLDNIVPRIENSIQNALATTQVCAHLKWFLEMFF